MRIGNETKKLSDCACKSLLQKVFKHSRPWNPQGTNPLAMWRAFCTTPSVSELADFALLLLSMSVNQAGLERNFSDLKINKTRLRNRLKLPRLEKMAKVRMSSRKPTILLSHTTRLVRTFERRRRKPGISKIARNEKTMEAK